MSPIVPREKETFKRSPQRTPQTLKHNPQRTPQTWSVVALPSGQRASCVVAHSGLVAPHESQATASSCPLRTSASYCDRQRMWPAVTLYERPGVI